MSTNISPRAGQRAESAALVNVAAIVTDYYNLKPDANLPGQQVAFGTSGHRGVAGNYSFNEWHVLAMTQAICEYRHQHGFTGPLFLGIDTHALSYPAFTSALEVLSANGVDTMIADETPYTPTPAVSHAILEHNRRHPDKLADGIVVTPSHNPPDNGGFKYNGPNGGPADTNITSWIEQRANALLKDNIKDVKRVPFDRALRAHTTHRHNYLRAYIGQLDQVLNMTAISKSGIAIGVNPLGGAGVHYWAAIAEHYRLNMEVLNLDVDQTFRFLPCDWDGQIRMDPSSAYAMTELIALKDRFDIAFACDTDHDRHGIVTKSTGLMPSNDYLSVAINYLFTHRPQWAGQTGIGKTLVSTQMIDRVAAKLGRTVQEVPVGFKWFVDGLETGSLGFAGEESAGASFSRLNGQAWSTDKDGITAALLSAEITAVTGRDPGQWYQDLTAQLGKPFNGRIEAAATPAQKKQISKLSPDNVTSTTLAGDDIRQVLTTAPANGKAFGGIKIETEHGWFAARPSGTEDIYKIYGESFKDAAHLQQIFSEAQQIVLDALK
jgi:phosphoglucomutase